MEATYQISLLHYLQRLLVVAATARDQLRHASLMQNEAEALMVMVRLEQGRLAQSLQALQAQAEAREAHHIRARQLLTARVMAVEHQIQQLSAELAARPAQSILVLPIATQPGYTSGLAHQCNSPPNHDAWTRNLGRLPVAGHNAPPRCETPALTEEPTNDPLIVTENRTSPPPDSSPNRTAPPHYPASPQVIRALRRALSRRRPRMPPSMPTLQDSETADFEEER